MSPEASNPSETPAKAPQAGIAASKPQPSASMREGYAVFPGTFHDGLGRVGTTSFFMGYPPPVPRVLDVPKAGAEGGGSTNNAVKGPAGAHLPPGPPPQTPAARGLPACRVCRVRDMALLLLRGNDLPHAFSRVQAKERRRRLVPRLLRTSFRRPRRKNAVARSSSDVTRRHRTVPTRQHSSSS